VAEGLLTPYRTKIDTALSGARAIELVKQNSYDIVFMDHMMPDMDGIEATEAIRAWEREQENYKEVSIIALTANAVSGMKEMFIEKGFSDFLAKPIDISKLDEMIDRWIPKEKREKGKEKKEIRNEESEKRDEINIPGVDIQHGLYMTGGDMAIYREILNTFLEDTEKQLTSLQNVPDTTGLPRFIINVHSIKSVCGSIGAAEISTRAEKFEAAGKAADIDFIRENLPGFAEDLAKLLNNIAVFLEKGIKR
jgi:CheY-like chemotaxis protein/HPt (histidine-containing phosphotransfer) domain-containing protein